MYVCSGSSITSLTFDPPPGTNSTSIGCAITSSNVHPGSTWTFSVVVIGSSVGAAHTVWNPANEKICVAPAKSRSVEPLYNGKTTRGWSAISLSCCVSELRQEPTMPCSGSSEHRHDL